MVAISGGCCSLAWKRAPRFRDAVTLHCVGLWREETLLTSSVVTEELPTLCPAQPSDQAGPQGDTPYCPEKCKQDVYVIVISTMSFDFSPGKTISEVAARLGGVS